MNSDFSDEEIEKNTFSFKNTKERQNVLTPKGIKFSFEVELKQKKNDISFESPVKIKPQIFIDKDYSDSSAEKIPSTSYTEMLKNFQFSSHKPSLTSVESRNKLLDYKSKFQEKKKEIEPPSESSLIPESMKNNEKYKLLTINKKLKNKKFTFSNSERKIRDVSNRKALDEAMNYAVIKKRKIIHSNKRHFYIILNLYDQDENEFQFPMYKDEDIGINEYWQGHIVESKADEDVDTDDEQLKIAGSFIVGEIDEAVNLVKEKGISEVQNTRFSKEIQK